MVERIHLSGREPHLPQVNGHLMCKGCGGPLIDYLQNSGWISTLDCVDPQCNNREDVLRRKLPTTRKITRSSPLNGEWHDVKLIQDPETGGPTLLLMHGFVVAGQVIEEDLYIYQSPYEHEVEVAFGVPENDRSSSSRRLVGTFTVHPRE